MVELFMWGRKIREPRKFFEAPELLFREQKASASVKHILLECYNLKNIRGRYFTCSSLNELLFWERSCNRYIHCNFCL